MSYLLINGSPRGNAGNSARIIEQIRDGIQTTAGIRVDTHLLQTSAQRQLAAKALFSADHAIVVFPLYTDAMPGIVMDFIEKLAPYRQELLQLKLGFIVHSGFPEAKQSRAIERYLLRLPNLLGATHLGTAICGGSMTLTPGRLKRFSCVGQALVKTGTLDHAAAKGLSMFEQLSPFFLPLMRLATTLPLMQHYWTSQLKQNGAYKDRNATPYAPDK